MQLSSPVNSKVARVSCAEKARRIIRTASDASINLCQCRKSQQKLLLALQSNSKNDVVSNRTKVTVH